jgi:signal transduction histidine kinase
MRRRLVLAWAAFAVVLLVVLEVPLAVGWAHRERDAALSSLEREVAVLAAAREEVVEGRAGGAEVSALVPAHATLLIAEPGTSPPPGELAHELARAAAGHPGSGRRGGELYAAAPVGESAEQHGAVALLRDAGPLDRRVRGLRLGMAGFGALVVAAAIGAAVVFARSVTRPLRRLGDAARALGAGDLSARVGATAGPAELGELAATFDAMAARIEDLVRSQQSFVADASHQLRTPLTALRLRLEALEAEPAESLEAAIAETGRMTRLVDALLTLAQGDGGRPPVVPVDVAALVEERTLMWTPLAAERNVALVADTRPASALLPSGVVEQVIDNYLDNALDVAPPGSTIVVSCRSGGSGVEVTVADDGPGLTDTERARAFDRFWRGRTGGEGVGLGLAIVRQLVERSGGSVWLRARAGGGTEAGASLLGR